MRPEYQVINSYDKLNDILDVATCNCGSGCYAHCKPNPNPDYKPKRQPQTLVSKQFLMYAKRFKMLAKNKGTEGMTKAVPGDSTVYTRNFVECLRSLPCADGVEVVLHKHAQPACLLSWTHPVRVDTFEWPGLGDCG
jgi:hypothetical protein